MKQNFNLFIGLLTLLFMQTIFSNEAKARISTIPNTTSTTKMITANETGESSSASISCPGDITVNINNASCSAIINYPIPTVVGTNVPTSIENFHFGGIHNGHSYFVSNFKLTPDQASATAASLGGYLVTITSEAENNFVNTLTSAQAWIGYTDASSEGNFGWVTGESDSFTNWRAGEPNNGDGTGEEDWTVINYQGSPKWNDWYNTSAELFIIEFSGISPNPTLISGIGSGGSFPMGTTTEVWQITEQDGSTSMCSFTVTVNDTYAPSPNVAILPTITDECSAILVVPTATDNCGTIISATTNDPIIYHGQGNHTVTWTYTDASGNSSTQTQTVIIDDVTPPTITCANDVTVNNDAGVCGAVVNFDILTTDNCPAPNAIINGDFENENLDGWTQVTYGPISASINDGNIYYSPVGQLTPLSGYNDMVISQFFISEILVSQPITVPNDADKIQLSWLDRYINNNDFFATDEQEFKVDILDDNMELITNVFTTLPGDDLIQSGVNARSYDLTQEVMAYAGQQIYLQFTVNSKIGHFIVALDEISMTFSEVSTIQTAGLPSGSVFPIGTTTNTFVATDKAGNTSTCSFDVTVDDVENPVIITDCPATIEVCGPQNITWTAPEATDNCSIASTVSNFNNGDFFEVGTHTVEYIFTDPSGNSVDCSFDITVHPLPEVTVEESLLPTWCQGAAKLEAIVTNEAVLALPVSYTWSNNLGNEATILAPSLDSYAVDVTDQRNCTTTTYYNLTTPLHTVLSGYTVITGEELEMAETDVLAGGVGVEDADEVEVEDDSYIAEFILVNEDELDVDNSSTINSIIDEDFDLALPTFKYNSNNNTQLLTVAAGTTMTLDGSNYGYIKVQNGATLIIDTPEIYIDRLAVYDNATVSFTQSTDMMVKRTAYFNRNVTVNADGHDVVLYAKGKVKVKQGSDVTLDIYTKQELKVNSSSSQEMTTMTGMFIAAKTIDSNPLTTWNWNLNCDLTPANPYALAINNNASTPAVATTGLTVYPNPTAGVLNVELMNYVGQAVTINITDVLGQTVVTKQIEEVAGNAQLNLENQTLNSGMYFISIDNGQTIQTQQFILNK